jgi:adenosylcobinamide-phosphate synthase
MLELVYYGLLIAFLGLILDLTLGEPPNALHPVVWIGKVIGGLDKRIKRTNQRSDRFKGKLLALTPLLIFP